MQIKRMEVSKCLSIMEQEFQPGQTNLSEGESVVACATITRDYVDGLETLKAHYKMALNDERNACEDRIGMYHWDADGQKQRIVREMDEMREQIRCLQDQLSMKEVELEMLKSREKIGKEALRRESESRVTAILEEKERELEKLAQYKRIAQINSGTSKIEEKKKFVP